MRSDRIIRYSGLDDQIRPLRLHMFVNILTKIAAFGSRSQVIGKQVAAELIAYAVSAIASTAHNNEYLGYMTIRLVMGAGHVPAIPGAAHHEAGAPPRHAFRRSAIVHGGLQADWMAMAARLYGVLSAGRFIYRRLLRDVADIKIPS